MPRPSNVPNIGTLRPTDTMMIDRPDATTANHTTVSDIKDYVNPSVTPASTTTTLVDTDLIKVERPGVPGIGHITFAEAKTQFGGGGGGGVGVEYIHPEPSLTGIGLDAYEYIVKFRNMPGEPWLYLKEFNGVVVDPPTQCNFGSFDPANSSDLANISMFPPSDQLQYARVEIYGESDEFLATDQYCELNGVWSYVGNAGWNDLRNPPYVFGANGESTLVSTDMGGSNLYVYLPSAVPAITTEAIMFDNQTSNRFVVFVQQAQNYLKSDSSWVKTPPVMGGEPGDPVYTILVGREQTLMLMRCETDASWEAHGELATILMEGSGSRSGWGNNAEPDIDGKFLRRFTLNEAEYKKIGRPIYVSRDELLELTGGPFIQTIVGYYEHVPGTFDSIIVNSTVGFKVNDSVYIEDCESNSGGYLISLIEDATPLGFIGKFAISFVGASLINYGSSIGMVQKHFEVGKDKLVAGASYEIYDFCTEHVIPKTTDRNTGINEPLIVKALTTSTLSPIATSALYPNDIIYYELVKSGRNVDNEYPYGRIYRRIDTTPNAAIDFPEDWRNVKYRRWTNGTTINPVLCSPQTAPNDFIVSQTGPLASTVSRIYIEITADGMFGYKEKQTDIGWLAYNIPISIPTEHIMLGNFMAQFVSDTHPIGTSWSMYIEGNYDQVESSGSTIGSIDIRPVQTRREPKGLSDITVGSNSGDLSNIVIAHDYFTWDYIPENEFAVGTHANINIGPDCKELTLCRGVGTFWLKGSYGGLIVKPGCHHIDIGMCGDGTYIGHNCSSINLGDNCSSIILGNACNSINVEDGIDQLIIPSGTVGRSYGMMTKPYKLDGATTGCGSPTVTHNFIDSTDFTAALPLSPGTWYTRGDAAGFTYLWDGYTHIQVSDSSLTLEPYRFGANFERHLIVNAIESFIRLPHANNPADAEFIATLKQGDRIKITTSVDAWVGFRNARGNYRDDVPMWNSIDGINYNGYRIGDKMDLEMVWEEANNRFNPVGMYAFTFRDAGVADGLNAISVSRNTDGSFSQYPLSQSQYLGMMNAGDFVDLGAKMLNVQQIGSGISTDKALVVSDVDQQAYSITVEELVSSACDRNAKLTNIGGFAIKLTAGENLLRGEIVYQSQAGNGMTATKNPIAGDMPFGTVLDDALSLSEVWVTVSGIGYALPSGGGVLTQGHILYQDVAVIGRAAGASSIAGAQHNREIGHALETGATGAAVKCVLHFN